MWEGDIVLKHLEFLKPNPKPYINLTDPTLNRRLGYGSGYGVALDERVLWRGQ